MDALSENWNRTIQRTIRGTIGSYQERALDINIQAAQLARAYAEGVRRQLSLAQRLLNEGEVENAAHAFAHAGALGMSRKLYTGLAHQFLNKGDLKQSVVYFQAAGDVRSARYLCARLAFEAEKKADWTTALSWRWKAGDDRNAELILAILSQRRDTKTFDLALKAHKEGRLEDSAKLYRQFGDEDTARRLYQQLAKTAEREGELEKAYGYRISAYDGRGADQIKAILSQRNRPKKLQYPRISSLESTIESVITKGESVMARVLNII